MIVSLKWQVRVPIPSRLADTGIRSWTTKIKYTWVSLLVRQTGDENVLLAYDLVDRLRNTLLNTSVVLNGQMLSFTAGIGNSTVGCHSVLDGLAVWYGEVDPENSRRNAGHVAILQQQSQTVKMLFQQMKIQLVIARDIVRHIDWN